ncbi:hypothetical protein HPB51_016611 [Rhipicephalus microplus]|uniref:Uncharacterized protein n=1 Tax=Rhipicephalus microplus TaxID=6941 RepID=A0A9J6EHW2_RHIMP|nr:hypothetical protein HPB51_016611 [Rhipicephalus microplus]
MARLASWAESGLSSGTVPLVSVLATLCFLLVVAGGATWYRYRLRRRTRAGLPFWSIELREDKPAPAADYQNLEAASSKLVVQDEEATRLDKCSPVPTQRPCVGPEVCPNGAPCQ